MLSKYVITTITINIDSLNLETTCRRQDGANSDFIRQKK